MKKVLFILLTAFAVASCNDDCDHNYGPTPTPPAEIVGSWYEEEENEEMRFSSSGTFYDKYCNTKRSFETEGRYELSADGRKLSYNYTYMGQTQYADWTVSNRDELCFTISSDKVGAHVLEKIEEAYTMTVGKTQQITFTNDHPNYTVLSYTSKNERIASVSENGLIMTNGEKGTTYIKIATNNGNAWVKVVVGDECHDLWYDYISLIRLNYNQVKAVLGNPDLSDGDQGYFYNMELHDVVQQVGLWLDPSTRIVDQFQLLLKEGVPSEVVMSYMESRYYKFKEIGNSVQFLNNSTVDNSVAIIEYNQDAKTIIIVDINKFYNLWPDFTSIFGLNKSQVKSKMDEMGYAFYQSFDSYSANGSDVYLITGYDMPYAVEFVFNPDDVVSQYWIYMNQNDESQFNALLDQYEYAEEEQAGRVFPFYNEDRTMRIELNLDKAAVTYTDLTKKQHKTPIIEELFADFTNFINKTRLTMAEMMDGKEPTRQYMNTCDYAITDNPYISNVYFQFLSKNVVKNGIQGIVVDIIEDADKDKIAKFLGTIYTHDKSSDNEMVFRSKDNLVNISFDLESNTIYYTPIGTLADPEADPYPQLWIDYTKYFGLTHDEAIAVMGEPWSDQVTMMSYPVVNDYVAAVYLFFDENTKKLFGMYVDGNDSTDAQIFIDALNKRYYYEGTETHNGTTYYKWRDAEDETKAKIILNFNPNKKRITYQVQ
jgi:hypothetical protein